MANKSLPHWDLTDIYPSLESPEFEEGFAQAVAQIKALAELFDAEHIERQENAVTDAATVKRFDTVMTRFNATLETLSTLYSYISPFVTTNLRDTLAQASSRHFTRRVSYSRNSRRGSPCGSVRWTQKPWLRTRGLRVEHEYALQRSKIEALHQMSPTEEDLAAELSVTGGSVWGHLHGDVSSQIMVKVELGRRNENDANERGAKPCL